MKNSLLPFLAAEFNGSEYFRLQNVTRTIVLIGLKDAARTLTGEPSAKDIGETFVSTERILKHAFDYAKRHAKKPRTRLTTAIIPDERASKRLAKLDLEKYGWGIVTAQGSKENPFYSDAIQSFPSGKEQLELEERIQKLTPGGHLALVGSEDPEPSPEMLISTTKRLASSQLRFFTYNSAFTHCQHCGVTSSGTNLKCQRCGSTGVHISGHFPRVHHY